MRSVITLAIGALLLAALIVTFGASAARAAAPVPFEQDAPAGVTAVGLQIDVQAHTAFTRTYSWAITKTAEPQALALFAGQNQPVNYTVTGVRSTAQGGYVVRGTVNITNPDPSDVAIIDPIEVDLKINNATSTIPAQCDSPNPFPNDYVLGPGASLHCRFSAPIAGSNTYPTATVTIASSGPVGGGTDSDGTGEAERVRYDTGPTAITVLDPLMPGGQKRLTTAAPSTAYSQVAQCPGDQAQYTDGLNESTLSNTATISETGQTSIVSVPLGCYAPDVTQTADTSFKRTWNWTIDKTANIESADVDEGEPVAVTYDVNVANTVADTDFVVTGAVSVRNPHPSAPMQLSLSSVIEPGLPVTLSCANPLTVNPGATATCTYTVDSLTDGTTRQKVATALFNGVDFTSSRALAFDNPSQEFNECVDVFDDKGVPGDPANDTKLGTLCRDEAPQTLDYALPLVGACPSVPFVNTARLAGSDTASLGSSTWTVTLNVAGCPAAEVLLKVMLPLVER